MLFSELYEELLQIAHTEFIDVVTVAEIMRLESGVPRKLRLRIIDGSYADVFVSNSGRYSYHWERIPGSSKSVYRHDNAPHNTWKHIATFPKHFHDSSENNVVASYISDEPQEALRQFCRFIRNALRDEIGA